MVVTAIELHGVDLGIDSWMGERVDGGLLRAYVVADAIDCPTQWDPVASTPIDHSRTDLVPAFTRRVPNDVWAPSIEADGSR